MTVPHVVVVGGGVGGLAAAACLARQGVRVTLCERAGHPGGKLRTRTPIPAAGMGAAVPALDAPSDMAIDAGPSVFTMRWVFDEFFAECGADFSAAIALQPAHVLARHVWRDGGAYGGGMLDLHADRRAAADAIAAFAGPAEAHGYDAFCRRAARIYQDLHGSFITAERPGMFALAARMGLARPGRLLGLAPFSSLWGALRQHFTDPRLLQLFGRYATYCGSSPMRAPATLMLIAHVEQEGVWLITGGMHRLAQAMAALAAAQGVTLRYRAEVSRILCQAGRVRAVQLAQGDEIAADAVIFNGDTAALADGLLGDAVRGAGRRMPPHRRSLSAMTWCADIPIADFPLLRHSVFFSDDYGAEFEALFGRRAMPDAPTVYVCAQDRDGAGALSAPARARGRERLLVLINAPALSTAGQQLPDPAALRATAAAMLAERGFPWPRETSHEAAAGPACFAKAYPGSWGAIYGPAGHGPFAAFRRAGAGTRVAGLYCAGGSVHPGPGLPMAALSGRLAAARLLRDLAGGRHRPVFLTARG